MSILPRGAESADRYDYLIVGAGFAGSVLAERLASQHGARILLIDRRPHIGGNAYDEPDEAGILYHKYGPHIFHTNGQQVVDYLSQFTEWRPYEHRVLARGARPAGADSDQPHDAQPAVRPRPQDRRRSGRLSRLRAPSRSTTFARQRTSSSTPSAASSTSCSSSGYTRKQWGLDPSELDKSVTARIPTRTNTDDRYFADMFQAMPKDGYTAMFEQDARASADRDGSSAPTIAMSATRSITSI